MTRTHRGGHPVYSSQEDAALIAAYLNPEIVLAYFHLPGRTERSIRNRVRYLKKLGRLPTYRPHLPLETDLKIYELWKEGRTRLYIMRRLGLSKREYMQAQWRMWRKGRSRGEAEKAAKAQAADVLR